MGLGYLGQYTKAGRHLFMQASAFGRTSDFRSDVGFVRRTNTNENDFYWSWNSTPKQKARFVSWNVESFNQLLYDWHGRIQGGQTGAHAFFNFQKQTFFGGGFDDRYEKDYEEEFGAKRASYQNGTFFNEPTRAAFDKVWFIGGGTTPNKTYSMQFFANFGYGAIDYDFGGGPKYPRVSPAAIQFGQNFPQLDPGAGRALDMNGTFSYKPTNELSLSLDYTKSRLRRYDTGLVAFDDNIYTVRGTYQFTRFIFARARVDYDTLEARMRGQFLLGLDAKSRHSPLRGLQRRRKSQRLQPLHRRSRTGFSPQRPDILHQDVLPNSEELRRITAADRPSRYRSRY
jgi:hypothetical protein